MEQFFHNLFATDFMPHVMCLRIPGVIWLHVVSDGLIAFAYLLIPIGLLRLLSIRKDLEFHWMFVLFASFILGCGATHILAVVVLWTPIYRFEGVVKAATAAISLATAFILIGLVWSRHAMTTESESARLNQILGLLGLKGLTARIPFTWQGPLRYTFSVFVVGLALFLRMLLRHQLGNELAFITYYPAVFLAAMVGGLGPGLVATFLGAAAVDYTVMLPTHSFWVAKTSDAIGMAFFFGTGCGMSVLSEGMQRMQLRVENLNQQLIQRMKEWQEAEDKNALLSAIVANSEDAIISKSLAGTITSWNRGAQRMFGYPVDQAIGQNISLIIPPEQYDEEKALKTALSKAEVVNHFETVRMHQNGHRVRVSLSISPILDGSGRAIGGSSILRDIGDRKRAEEQFRLVVESAPNAMVMIDRAGQITLVNQLTEEWFGYSRSEMMGKRVEMLLPERFREAHPGHRTGFFAKPAVVGPSQRAMGSDRELFARRKDGSEFPIEVGLNPIATEQGPMVLSAIVDVTARKQVEENIREFNRTLEMQVLARTVELRSANKELEDFAYVASHDLKAPLRVIDNCSKWIEEDLEEHLSGETRENMKLLRGRVKRMEKLLDDLLEYARIGRAGTQDSETIPGDRLMKNIVDLLAPEGFTVNVSPAFSAIRPPVMPLQQILLNLIGNAIKHHHLGKGTIDVSVEDRGAMYAFAVKDDGPGIEARFHEQVFKMFQTLRPRDQVEGSGMGLAMVRKHVEVAGGTMELQSAPGQGSIFRFTWPKPVIRKEEDAEVYAPLRQTT